MMNRIMLAAIAAFVTGTASAEVPLFAAKCPSGLNVDSSRDGKVYINGKAAKVIKRPDGQISANSAGVWIDITPQGGRMPIVTYTAKDKSTGACEVVSFKAPGGGGRILSVALDHDGKWLAGGTAEDGVKLWDLRPFRLLNNGPAPSPRAALIAEILQRLWGLRLDGLELKPENWTWLEPRNGHYLDPRVEIDIRPAAATADPDSQPVLRPFDIRPLLAPPAPGQNKLEQLLQWLDEQSPRLRP